MKTLTFFFFTIVFLNPYMDNFINPFERYKTELAIHDLRNLKELLADDIQQKEFADVPCNIEDDKDSIDYWIFTSYVDRLIIRDHQGERIIKKNRMDQTFFTAKCDISNPSYICLENDNCEANPTLMVCTPQKKKCTRIIHLEYGEEILLDSCLDKYPPEDTSIIYSFYSWVKSVFEEVMEGQVACGPSAGLKGNNSALSEDLRLIFTQTDYSYFIDRMDFDLRFNTVLNSPIESIYIIEHNSDDDLVFCAGDVSDMKDVYDLSNKLIPNIGMVVEQFGSRDTMVEYRFIDSILETMAFKELKKGQWYELDVKLKNDPTYYVFNFQFLSDEDLKYLKTFEKNE